MIVGRRARGGWKLAAPKPGDQTKYHSDLSNHVGVSNLSLITETNRFEPSIRGLSLFGASLCNSHRCGRLQWLYEMKSTNHCECKVTSYVNCTWSARTNGGFYWMLKRYVKAYESILFSMRASQCCTSIDLTLSELPCLCVLVVADFLTLLAAACFIQGVLSSFVDSTVCCLVHCYWLACVNPQFSYVV